jgi:hypothetical protein
MSTVDVDIQTILNFRRGFPNSSLFPAYCLYDQTGAGNKRRMKNPSMYKIGWLTSTSI